MSIFSCWCNFLNFNIFKGRTAFIAICRATFDKSGVGNLEYSLQRGCSQRTAIGGYMSTTIVCCNTRRYHGLMVAPDRRQQPDLCPALVARRDGDQHDRRSIWPLHTTAFPGFHEPRGHKLHHRLQSTRRPPITYRVGGVILRKEMLWIHKRTQLMIIYIVDALFRNAPAAASFSLSPRQTHALTHAFGRRRAPVRRWRREMPPSGLGRQPAAGQAGGAGSCAGSVADWAVADSGQTDQLRGSIVFFQKSLDE